MTYAVLSTLPKSTGAGLETSRNIRIRHPQNSAMVFGQKTWWQNVVNGSYRLERLGTGK